ncbi:L-aspartate oxidase [Psychrobacter aquaticus]|uniref:L-aspartate oxidase n=1 Tax=Psychrobacter aquaticus CMS 56 TaxID=1354303 RepID=U4TBS7_9GAMM|nr:L-aspartate oxidase [Psychrobacter aquaticus]ERL56179.1 L-aspartate oxidase [Psychrobacter aquaticus CMS 56]
MSEAFKAEAVGNDADDTRQTDVLIIGAGLAGLSTALSLPKSLNITVLSKDALEVCSSHYAQGGIAASLDKNDSVTDHIADTLIAGAGLCEIEHTTSILSAGQQAVQWLCEQGVPFTQNPDTQISQQNAKKKPLTELHTSDLHLTQEGGHGCRRVAHADDATGRHIMEALNIKAHAATNITILPYHEALTLLTSPFTDSQLNPHARIKHCQGALVFDHINQRQFTFRSRTVVLASGGLGQLFKRASAPNVCVGDGVMMAWQAGCRLANLEFIQFHPTGLALADSSFLISEALRGEGGRLYCPQTGTRFMLDVDARAELAPRDIVARAIAEQIHHNKLGYVHLDVSHLPATFLRAHFPQIDQTLRALGINMTVDPIPVAPTAHYSCGGVVTCANGLTDVAGLYAAGEVAYTGLHGANRLASNSLLECVVVGRNIAKDLPRYLKNVTARETDSFTTVLPTSSYATTEKTLTDIWTPPRIAHAQFIKLPSPVFNKYGENNSKGKFDPDSLLKPDITKVTAELKTLMTDHMGITRCADALEQALTQIQAWQQWLTRAALPHQSDAHDKSSVMVVDELAYLQLARQLQLATLIIQSAYQRFESRGGHYRKDCPTLATMPLTSVIESLSDQLYHQHTDFNQSVKAAQPYPHSTQDDHRLLEI